MSTENIVIQVREDGSRVVSRNLRDIGTAARGSQDAVGSLKSALAGLAGALALSELAKYADTWTRLKGKVDVFSHSAAETTKVMDELYGIAQRTRQPIDAVGSSFHRLSIAASSLGATQQQTLNFTESVGMALAIQGTSAEAARGGILQLGQAMGEGIVRAQEYNSMIESMPIVLKTVANNIDGVDGSLAKLRQRMLAGKLTSKEFFAALLEGMPQLREQFDRSGKTIEQAFTIMRNAAIKYVGDIDQSYQISQKFFAAAQWGTQHINDLANALLIMASPKIVQGLNGVAAAMARMAVAAAANPFVTLAAAVTMAVTALVLYRDELIVIEQGQVSLGDYMRASWQSVSGWIADAAKAVSTQFAPAMDDLRAIGNTIMTLVSYSLNMMKTNANYMIATFVLVGKTIGIVAAAIPDMFKEGMTNAVNAIKGKAADVTNALIDIINIGRQKVGASLIDHVQVEQTANAAAGATQQMMDAVNGVIKESIGTDYIGELGAQMSGALDGINKKAEEIAKARHKAEADAKATAGAVDLNSGGGAGDDYSTNKKDKGIKSLEKSLRSIVSTVAPAEGALLQLKHAEDILQQSLAKGLITRDQYNKYLALTRHHYDEQANPLKVLNRELDEQTRVLGMNVDAREVENQVLATRKELMSKGVTLDAQELQALRDRYAGLQNLNKAVQAQDGLLQNSIEKRKEFVRQLEAIKALMSDSSSGFTAADANSALVANAPELFKGTQEYVQSVADAYQNMFDQINAMRQADLISDQTASQMKIQTAQQMQQAVMQAEIEAAQYRLDNGSGDWADSMLNSMSRVTEGFTSLQRGVSDAMGQMFVSLTDGFSNSVASAITSGEDLRTSLANVAQTVVQQLIASLIKLGIQWAINAALAQTMGAATTAASVGMAAATAAAWTPAATMVSLATLGANAGPATAGMAATMAAGKSMSLVGMAHSGLDDIPEEGTWLLDKGERVVDSRTNADLKGYLSGKQQDSQPQNGNVIQMNVRVINNTNAQVSTQEGQDEDGNPTMDIMIDQVESELASRMASGRGELHSATKSAFGLRSNPRAS